jgi:hypothetical protein
MTLEVQIPLFKRRHLGFKQNVYNLERCFQVDSDYIASHYLKEQM